MQRRGQRNNQHRESRQPYSQGRGRQSREGDYDRYESRYQQHQNYSPTRGRQQASWGGYPGESHYPDYDRDTSLGNEGQYGEGYGNYARTRRPYDDSNMYDQESHMSGTSGRDSFWDESNQDYRNRSNFSRSYGEQNLGYEGYEGQRGGYGQDSYGQGSYQDQGTYRGHGGSGRGGSMSGRNFDNRDMFSGRGSSQSTSGRSFRGIGPKDYKRSDDRIKEEVCDRLTDDYEVDAENISVQVESGEVRLKGNVPDRSTKRRAEDLAEGIAGVSDVINELKVQSENVRSIGERGSSGSMSGTESNNRSETSKSDKQTRRASGQ